MSNVILKHIIFVLIGVICFLVCACGILWGPPGKVSQLWVPFLTSLGCVILGVGLVHFVWEWLGRPSRHGLCALADKSHKLGVVDVWRARVEDAGKRSEEYVKWIEKSREVNLMGLNLVNEIFDVDAVKNSIINAINNNTNVRIVISEPDTTSRITKQRLSEPGEERGEDGKVVFPQLLWEAQKGVKEICKKLDDPEKFLDNIRFAHKSVIYCMIIRFDDQMFVSNYLLSVLGNQTPGMQIRKVADEGLFERYLKEFDDAWERGRELSDKEREEIIKS